MRKSKKEEEKNLSYKKIFASSWSLFRLEWSFFVVITLLALILSYIDATFGVNNKENSLIGIHITVTVIAQIIVQFVMFGYIRTTLASVRGGTPDYEVFMSGFRDARHVLIYFIAMVFSFVLTFAGLIIFIVPGFIVTIYLSLLAYVVVDQRIMPIRAMALSALMVRGRFLYFVKFFLIVVGINVFGALSLVGLLVSVPMTVIAYAIVYDEVMRTMQKEEVLKENQKPVMLEKL